MQWFVIWKEEGIRGSNGVTGGTVDRWSIYGSGRLPNFLLALSKGLCYSLLSILTTLLLKFILTLQ